MLKAVAPIAAVLAAFWVVSFYGIDYGHHWDEDAWRLNLVRSIRTDLYLPQAIDYGKTELTDGFYGYPSFLYATSIIASSPEFFTLAPAPLIEFVNSKAFILRLRAVCIVISSLTLLWVYLSVLRITGDRAAAGVAAGVLLGSWEFGYHARWVAADAICAQWAALTAYLTILAVQSAKLRNLAWAAAAAGAAASTKYTAGALLLIPVCGMILLRPRTLRSSILQMAMAFGCAFLLITPGAVLQPRHLLAWMKYVRDQYAGNYYCFTIAGGPLVYARHLLLYLMDVAWSNIPMVGLVVGLGAVVGVYRARPRYRAVLLIYPVVFLAFLCTERVLIIRNVIPVLPFLAIFAGIGVMGSARASVTGRAVLILIACLGVAWQFAAAKSIREPVEAPAKRMIEWAKDHTEFSYQWSPDARQIIEKVEPRLLHTALRPGKPSLFVMYVQEDSWLGAVANQPELFYKDFGPYDVNLDYYPTWVGGNHIVILDSDRISKYLPVVFDTTIAQTLVTLRVTPPANAIAYVGVLDGWKSADLPGPKVTIREGETFQWSQYAALSKIYSNGLYGWNRIVVDVSGLDTAKRYTLHITWWDADQRRRVESIYLNDREALTKVVLPRKPRDVEVELPQSARTTVSVVRELGVNAVINEIWLEEVSR